MPPLLIAAGGGGDAITAAALTRVLGLTELPVVMTFSWDRLMIGPLPGPRSAEEFTGLRALTPTVAEVVATTRPRPPAGSALPRLAAELPARLLLLDPAAGAAGLARQIADAAGALGLDEIVLLDVGGDILTTGREDPGLRSPLADQLTLAACVRTGIPTRLLVTGAGLDGELPEKVITDRLDQLGSASLGRLTSSDIAPTREVFSWHPSEASGLLAAAATGTRGIVEVRDAADQVVLHAATTALVTVDAAHAIDRTPARFLTDTNTFADAARIVAEITGMSEVVYETRKAAAMKGRTVHDTSASDLPTIDRHAAATAERGAHYLSTRRLAEMLGVTTLDAYALLSQLLAEQRPSRYRPSLYDVR